MVFLFLDQRSFLVRNEDSLKFILRRFLSVCVLPDALKRSKTTSTPGTAQLASRSEFGGGGWEGDGALILKTSQKIIHGLLFQVKFIWHLPLSVTIVGAFWEGTSIPGYTNKGTVLSKTPLRLILLLLIPDLHNFITRFLTTLHIKLVISAISRSICSLSSCPSSSVLLVTSLTAAPYSRNRCRSSSMMAASVFCEGVEKRVINYCGSNLFPQSVTIFRTVARAGYEKLYPARPLFS